MKVFATVVAPLLSPHAYMVHGELNFSQSKCLQTLKMNSVEWSFHHCHPTKPVPLQIKWLERIPHMFELQL